MNGTTRSRLLLAALFASLLSVAAPRCHADQWTAPTQEELSMTSQPQVPGAAAVYLYREQTTDDHLHSFSIYVRLKVLTEKGKEYSNVELDYASRQGGGGYTIENVVGRTIHPDGTIIPFTGKPYDKLIEKTQGVKYMAKVFTMPDVQVGSIIEYRYALRYDDHYFIAPKWFVQSKLYTRRSHYGWRPTSKSLVSSDERGQLTSAIAWFPVLPAGAELKNTRLPPIGGNEGQLVFELNMHDIPPAPDEEYMPPISSLSYRVLFYYTPYHDPADFWKNEGKYWGKQSDKFMNPGSRVKAAVQELTTPADTQDQKLRKLYAAVMKLENTDFTREHSSSEEKAQGLKEIRTADDIWDRKRGSSDQLSELFVSMARAAGMKSYLMAVTNRDRNIFLEGYLSLSQLDDYIAIVNIDGKEQYFDPGSRYCPYQHLEWKHTFANGIRQTENGSALGATPGDPYTNQRISRVANLTMDQQGRVSGSVDMIYIGAPALAWRHSSLRGDRTGLERELRVSLEELLPNGMDVKVVSIDALDDYEHPLKVKFEIKGAIGSSTGKRLLINGDIFESNSKPSFPHEKREIPVYFHYPYIMQDAVRVKFPDSIKVESLPASAKEQFQNFALYTLSTESTPTSVTFRRNYSLAEIVFMPKEYADLRSFYSKMETKDQESVVLTAAPAAPAAPAKATTAGN